ncbi:linear amide C-N hydrolase [Draconibacterium sediminis]|uniref:Choloylglycine hydrolase/NAAA C-terminal domain-containing protein n=1 Tax=Draconibacterium sediminis TaxID=1544798 RepID=A0A0D8J5X6_9BACT|nr:linear amide C-N hydrolase [Draconibacterium sediminis]KJF42184.1 hypothetical protein LH29_20495 [Draconibacterium sediminis]
MCTSFTIKTDSELIFGRNLDVETDIGTVFINPREVKKTAYISRKCNETPAVWRSKFGSITFNQISKDIPHGGMNEKGLVVEHLFLEESVYEQPDERPALISHQWIQYMLDSCKSVNEIIKSCTEVRISNVDFKFPIHFNTMDRNGDSAIFEFINGKMLVYKNNPRLDGVLSNNTIENSLNQNEHIKDIGKNNYPTDVANSLERYNIAKELVEKYEGQNEIDYSFSILDAVSNNTQWKIVYDIKNMKIYYITNSSKKVRTMNVKDYDFTYYTSRTIDINKNPNVKNNWVIYNHAINSEIINSICDKSEFINSILGKEEIASYDSSIKKWNS